MDILNFFTRFTELLFNPFLPKLVDDLKIYKLEINLFTSNLFKNFKPVSIKILLNPLFFSFFNKLIKSLLLSRESIFIKLTPFFFR